MDAIPQEKLERVLELYKPECRYLKEAKIELLKAEGMFEVNSTYYANNFSVSHLTSVEMNLCLNQLAYVAFAEWIDAGEFENINLDFEEYFVLIKENMYIVESSIKFKEPIATSKPFKAAMQLRQQKQKGNVHFVFLDYSFEDGKAKGRVGFALTLDDSP